MKTKKNRQKDTGRQGEKKKGLISFVRRYKL